MHVLTGNIPRVKELDKVNPVVSQNFDQKKIESFNQFNELGGKFRVAIINRCNLNCFFCHNEGMINPREPDSSIVFFDPKTQPCIKNDDLIISIINAYTALGGKSVNITGGDPLLHHDFSGLMNRIQKGNTNINLNTNSLAAGMLLRQPLIKKIDALYISLHTTKEKTHQENLGAGSAAKIKENIKKLKEHGYHILLNCSIGPHNIADFPDVLEFALYNKIDLKVISLVRHDKKDNYYHGQWVNPENLNQHMERFAAILVSTTQALGGIKNQYKLDSIHVTIKNIAKGRMFTSFCQDCQHQKKCGEGIYGVRVGVDGIWKPCLLRREKFNPVDADKLANQILDNIHEMMGDAQRRRYITGAPD